MISSAPLNWHPKHVLGCRGWFCLVAVIVFPIALGSGCSRHDVLGKVSPQRPDGSTGATVPADRDATRGEFAEKGDWPMVGKDYQNQRFSGLTEITTQNVGG